MSFTRVLLLVLISTTTFGQKVSVGGMDISWEFHNDKIAFTATAPDDGWVALGFNDNNDIVGSNLIMISVQESSVKSEEFYVVAMGNPQPVSKLGSSNQHVNVSGEEDNEKTTVLFSMPTTKIDDKHYNLKSGDTIWLICAFSMEDEFDHHSRMRKHVRITL